MLNAKANNVNKCSKNRWKKLITNEVETKNVIVKPKRFFTEKNSKYKDKLIQKIILMTYYLKFPNSLGTVLNDILKKSIVALIFTCLPPANFIPVGNNEIIWLIPSHYPAMPVSLNTEYLTNGRNLKTFATWNCF